LSLYPFLFINHLGSSLSAYYRILAINECDLNINILTYPNGQDLKNFKIFRSYSIIRFKEYKPGEYWKKLVYDLQLLLKSFRIINKYDIVITHASANFFIYFYRLFYRRIYFIATVHGNLENELKKWNISKSKSLGRLFQKFEENTLKLFGKVIVEHKSTYLQFLEKGLKKADIRLIELCAIPIKELQQENVSKIFNIVYTGTFVNVQNIDLIINAAKYLSEENIKFTLIGAFPSELKRYTKILNENNLADKISILQRMNKNDLYQYYNNANVLISPRIYGNDTPMKIFEYLSTGRCVLATDKPIHTGILNSENAFLFIPTPEKLSEAIIYLRDNPFIRQKLGEKAKADYETLYSFNVLKEKYIKLFESLQLLD
jgi:glycosyltransferase involved in cell wall biosynthesis